MKCKILNFSFYTYHRSNFISTAHHRPDQQHYCHSGCTLDRLDEILWKQRKEQRWKNVRQKYVKSTEVLVVSNILFRRKR